MSVSNRIKKRQNFKKKAAFRLFAFLLSANLLASNLAFAQPAGMTIVNGTATPSVAGATTTITASDRAILNWSTFNIFCSANMLI